MPTLKISERETETENQTDRQTDRQTDHSELDNTRIAISGSCLLLGSLTERQRERERERERDRAL